MQTKLILISLLMLAVIAGAVTIVALKIRQDKAVTASNNSATQGGIIPLDQNIPQSSSDENLLKVGGDNTSTTPTLPTPDQFGQYEQYKDATSVMFAEVEVGTGTEAVADKKVAVEYKGWLTDGTLFDQSKDGEPIVFTLGAHQVIVGWDQGISGMKVGGKRRLVIPSSVGYGPNGTGPIPGGAMLIFDVELMAVE